METPFALALGSFLINYVFVRKYILIMYVKVTTVTAIVASEFLVLKVYTKFIFVKYLNNLSSS